MKRFSAFASAVVLAAATIACSSTDAGITTNVKSQFAADDTVRAYEIDVTTQNGIVTLSGDVDSAAAKQQAVQIARSTEGVTDVIDNLVIMRDTAATGGLDIDGPDADVDVNIDDGAVERGAERAGEAIERGAEATGDAARRAGERARDAVTDDDSNNDGN